MDAKRRAAIAQLVADALVEKKRDQKHYHHVFICGQDIVPFDRADAQNPPTEADAIMATISYKNEIRKVVERVIRSLT